MKSIKLVGLCLAAALLVSAAATATAWAEAPEFGSEVKEGSRDFSSKGGTFTLETTKGERITCEKETNTGELEAIPTKKLRKISVGFKECTTTVANKVYLCGTLGFGPEIRTFELLGRIGYVKKAEMKVGLLLNPEEGAANPKDLIAEVECIRPGEPTLLIKVKGSVIALITPVNKLVDPGSPFVLNFAKEGTGKQVDKKFEGETENHLLVETPTSGGGFIESAYTGEIELFFLISLELKA
jgi:hypothetical protein